MADNSLIEHQFSAPATAVSYERSRPIQPPFNIVYWPVEIAEHYCRRVHRGNRDKHKHSNQSTMETIGEGMEAKNRGRAEHRVTQWQGGRECGGGLQ